MVMYKVTVTVALAFKVLLRTLYCHVHQFLASSDNDTHQRCSSSQQILLRMRKCSYSLGHCRLHRLDRDSESSHQYLDERWTNIF